jgi:uncharacterized iron-regulated protein
MALTLRPRLLAGLLSLLLSACASPTPDSAALARHLEPLLPTQVLLVGEQHDAPSHQEWHRRIVAHLAQQRKLAALVLEMANAGGSTAGLKTDATEAQVRDALRWDERAWPWGAYGPAVMAAVHAGRPVLGGNLPAEQMRERMRDAALDARLPAAALARQQGLMREGHCGLLPESQIAPMARIQIARDLRMAQTVEAALALAAPGQVVVLMAGSVHADKQLGVPQHLAAGVRSASLRLQADGRALEGESFDKALPTPPAPPVDHCARLAEQFKKKAPAAN